MRYLQATWLAMAIGNLASAQQTLTAVLQSNPNLSTLLELVTLVPGLVDTLSGATNITILAPTNQAFASIQPGIPEQIAVQNRNVSSVAGLLANHVIRGSYPASAFTNVPVFVQTLLNTSYFNDIQPFTNTTGGQYIGGIKNGQDVNILSGEFTVSKVITADIRVGQGVIVHVIDQVLSFGAPFQLYAARAGLTAINNAIQAARIDNDDGVDSAGSVFNAADKTIFVPSNEAFELIGSVVDGANRTTLTKILDYHVLDSINFSPTLRNMSVPTTNGGNNLSITVTDNGNIFVNNAKVILPNIILWNGVAHVIDEVLNPDATFDRRNLNPSAPAAQRTMYSGATTKTSLAFTTYSIPTGESYSIAPIYTTALAIAPASTTRPVVTGTSRANSTAVYTAGSEPSIHIGGLFASFALIAASWIIHL